MFCLDSAKSVTTLGEDLDDSDDGLCDESHAVRDKSSVPRANNLAPDRPDIQYIVKELCQNMARPRRCDWARLRRFGRCFFGEAG